MWPFAQKQKPEKYSVNETRDKFCDLLKKRNFKSAPEPFGINCTIVNQYHITISDVVVARVVDGYHWSGLKLTDVGEAMRDEIIEEMRKCIDADEKAVNMEIEKKVSVVREALHKFYHKEK